MSVDTIKAVVSFTETNIVTPNDYEFIDSTKNEDIEDLEGCGPYIVFDLEVFDDDVEASGSSENTYSEEGVIVFRIFTEIGSGNRDIFQIMDKIRAAFRDTPDNGGYRKITTDDGGVILITNIRRQKRGTKPFPQSDYDWNRYDFMINYNKFYNE